MEIQREKERVGGDRCVGWEGGDGGGGRQSLPTSPETLNISW